MFFGKRHYWDDRYRSWTKHGKNNAYLWPLGRDHPSRSGTIAIRANNVFPLPDFHESLAASVGSILSTPERQARTTTTSVRKPVVRFNTAIATRTTPQPVQVTTTALSRNTAPAVITTVTAPPITSVATLAPPQGTMSSVPTQPTVSRSVTTAQTLFDDFRSADSSSSFTTFVDREKLRFCEPQHRCQLLAREHLLFQRHFSHLSKCNNRKYHRFSRTSERPLTEHLTGHHAPSDADCDTNYSRCSTSHCSGPCSATSNGADTDHCYPYATAKISEFHGDVVTASRRLLPLAGLVLAPDLALHSS